MKLPPFRTRRNQRGYTPTQAQLEALARGRAKRHPPREPKFCYCGQPIPPGPNYGRQKYCSHQCAWASQSQRENGRRCGLNHGRHAIARYRKKNPYWRTAVSTERRKYWEAWRAIRALLEADLGPL